MESQGTKALNRIIFSRFSQAGNDKFGFSNKKLPMIVNSTNKVDKVNKVDEPVKISHNFNNNKIKNNLKNNPNLSGAKKKLLINLKNEKATMNLPSVNNVRINKNASNKTLNTQDNSITRTESEISFRTNRTISSNRNNSFTPSENPKKRAQLRIEGSKPQIITSHSISRNGNKNLIYLNTDRNSNERYIQERKIFNELAKNIQIKNNFFTKTKLDAIDLSKAKKNTDIKKNTTQNEDNIIKKEDNQINGVNAENKKEKEITHGQNEICDTKDEYIKTETMIQLDKNKINDIFDNIKEEDIPDEKSIIDNNNIKKDLEIKPEENSVIVDKNIKKETKVKLEQNNISNNNNIKTDTELKLAQNNIGNNNNIKTDTELKLDQNNIGNNKNIKTNTNFNLDQNIIGTQNGEESETKIILEKAFKGNLFKNDYNANKESNEKKMQRNNTQDTINLLIMKKNDKNKRVSSSCDILKNQNRNNNYLNNNNNNNNYVPNNYFNNNFCLPNINRVNNNNLYNNNDYNNYNNLYNNYLKIDYDYYSNNNFYNI